MNELEKWLTLGRMAQRLGILEGQLRRMCNRGEISFTFFNGLRVLCTDDIEKIRARCVVHGYLKPEPAAA